MRRKCARLAFTHLFADFGVIQEGIGAVRQSIQILPKAVFYIEFSEIFVRMDICKHMTTIHVGSQHHQLRYGNDSAVFLHMILDLHLQETFQRCFLTLIQLGKLFRHRIELEDGHTLVQMRGKIVETVEFIHLPVDISRRLCVNLLEGVHHLVLADRKRQLHAAFIARCAAYQIDLTYFAQGSFLPSVPVQIVPARSGCPNRPPAKDGHTAPYCQHGSHAAPRSLRTHHWPVRLYSL